MELSARNQLKGEVVRVKSGTIMAEVEVKVDAGSVVAAITDGSLKRLGIKAGDRVTVIIKATVGMLGKLAHRDNSAFRCRVAQLHGDCTAKLRRGAARGAPDLKTGVFVCSHEPLQ